MAGKLFKASGPMGLMLLLMISTNFRCGEEKFPEYVDMTFVIPASFSPVRSVKIGDTLWLSADFPDTILELNSMKYYKIINMDFKELLAVLKLTEKELTISQQPGGLDSFILVKKIGDLIYPGEIAGDLKFLYQNNAYLFKMALIPSQPGVFCINFIGPFSRDGFDTGLHLDRYIDLGYTIDGRKRIPIHKATYVVINDGETNFDLFQQYCKAVSLSVPPVERNIYYEQKSTFTFEVK